MKYALQHFFVLEPVSLLSEGVIMRFLFFLKIKRVNRSIAAIRLTLFIELEIYSTIREVNYLYSSQLVPNMLPVLMN